MTADTAPVATVTGLYRCTGAGLEPLTKETPLTPDEVRDAPVFFELELADNDTDLVVDVSYDNMEPVRLPDLFRGMDIPRGIRFWPDWFDIPPYREAPDMTGRTVYPRAPGIHTVRIGTARRLRQPSLRNRYFCPDNRSYTSPLFEFAIAAPEPAGRSDEKNEPEFSGEAEECNDG